MSASKVAALLALIAVVGAGALWLAQATDTPAAAPRAEARADDGTPSESDADEQLRRRIASLEARVTRLEVRERLGAGAPTLESEEDDDAHPVDDPVFEAAVRDVVDQVEGEQQAARRARQQRRMKAWTGETADEIAEVLELDDAQRARVQKVMQEHVEKIMELRDRPIPDGGSLRGRYRNARAALDAQIDQILTPAQKRTADELRESGEFPGSWRRGRRGR